MPNNNLSLVISINDSEWDISKATFIFKVLERKNQKPIFLINDNQNKKKYLNNLSIKPIILGKNFTTLFFFMFGFGRFLQIKKKKLRKEFSRISFNSFVLAGQERLGGLRYLNLKNYTASKIKFFLWQNISSGIVHYFQKKGIKIISFEDRVKQPESSIYFESILRGIKFIQFARGPKKNSLVFKKLTVENYWHHPLSDTEAIFKNQIEFPSFSSTHEDELVSEMTRRYTDNHWYDRDKITSQAFKLGDAAKINQLFGKDFYLVVPHIVWDATFCYGENIFIDYLSWLERVITNIANYPQKKFVIKLHPDLDWKSKMLKDVFSHRGFIDDLVHEKKIKNIKVLTAATEIATIDLIKQSMGVITVRGTTGLEAACFGKKVLTAGSGRYSHLGFTVDSVNDKDFDINFGKFVSDPTQIGKLQVLNARKLAYRLFFQKPITFSSLQYSRDITKKVDIKELINDIDELLFKSDDVVDRLGDWMLDNEYDFYNC